MKHFLREELLQMYENIHLSMIQRKRIKHVLLKILKPISKKKLRQNII